MIWLMSNCAAVGWCNIQRWRVLQVRDMTSDGGVVKRTVRPGRGEFPVDCPLEDSLVRVHYRFGPHPPAARQPAWPVLPTCTHLELPSRTRLSRVPRMAAAGYGLWVRSSGWRTAGALTGRQPR